MAWVYCASGREGFWEEWFCKTIIMIVVIMMIVIIIKFTKGVLLVNTFSTLGSKLSFPFTFKIKFLLTLQMMSNYRQNSMLH